MKSHRSNLIAKFASATNGAIAVIFAIVSVAVVGVVGIAVDFVNASSTRASLQNALDGAVLAAVAGKAETDAEAQALMTEYMASNWSQKFPSLDVQMTPTVSDDAISAEAVATMPTMITGVLGIQTMTLSVASTARTSSEVMEIAMVIDNSNSMNPNLDSLKSALNAVVDTLAPNGDDEDIKFSIIPSAVYVNVGVDNKNESWLSFADADEATWTGCVGSRDYPLELDDTGEEPIPAVGPYVFGQPCNTMALLPLTSNTATVKTSINNFSTAVDDSFVAAGPIWGLRALSEREPLTEALPYGETQKIMIWLTDGLSTVGPLYPLHDNEDNADLVASLYAQQCVNIKAKGIVVYTVAFNTAVDHVNQVSACATSSSHAFVADNANEMIEAFEAIAKKMATIYLSQ